MSLSNYLEDKLLNHITNKATFTPPATIYVALFKSDPGESGVGTEVSASEYARQPITFGAVASGTVSNSANILFPVATSLWGTVTHVAFMDALTGGNMLASSSLTQAKAIDVDQQFVYQASNLSLSLD